MENVVDVKSEGGMFIIHNQQSTMVNLSHVSHIVKGVLGSDFYIRFYIRHKDHSTIQWTFSHSNGGENERDRILKKIQSLYGESL